MLEKLLAKGAEAVGGVVYLNRVPVGHFHDGEFVINPEGDAALAVGGETVSDDGLGGNPQTTPTVDTLDSVESPAQSDTSDQDSATAGRRNQRRTRDATSDTVADPLASLGM